ncbi:hypothetical protein TB2_019529 [Malus domestica]
MPRNSSKLTGTSAPVTQNLYRPFDVEAINVVYIPTEANFVEGSKQLELIKWDLEAWIGGRRHLWSCKDIGRCTQEETREISPPSGSGTLPAYKELQMMPSKRMEIKINLQITEREVRCRRNWSGSREDISWGNGGGNGGGSGRRAWAI